MELALAKKIVDVCEDAGVEVKLRTEYSGRNMFGKTTTGVVVESITLAMAAIISSAHEFVEPDEDDLDCSPYAIFSPDGFSTDSMGHNAIIY